ncbi:hypothetical protein G7046_g8861 [Stylonectria norvegica]|nr:hypothetical protein G7046_g8861 [Stylonectria norvegica]
MSRTPVFTKKAPAPLPGVFSQAIIANGFVYTSGAVPSSPATGKLIDGDIQAHTHQCIQNLGAILEEAGSSLNDVIEVNVFLSDMKDFAKMNEVYVTYWGDIKPVRTCVAVKTLPGNTDVEIKCVGIVKKTNIDAFDQRHGCKYIGDGMLSASASRTSSTTHHRQIHTVSLSAHPSTHPNLHQHRSHMRLETKSPHVNVALIRFQRTGKLDARVLRIQYVAASVSPLQFPQAPRSLNPLDARAHSHCRTGAGAYLQQSLPGSLRCICAADLFRRPCVVGGVLLSFIFDIMAKGGKRNGCLAFLASDHNNFFALILTTPISIILLYSTLKNVLFSGKIFQFVTDNRPTVQFAVQIFANVLSMLQIIVLCRLINFGVRRYLTRQSMELDQLRAWNDAMVPRVNWDLPFGYGLVLLGFVSISMVFSAIWAAALTPVETSIIGDGSVTIPSWDNVTLIKEYPSEVGWEGPTEQNVKGRFTYSVGIQLLGSLLASASSATPLDNGPRTHGKMDKTRYNYIGRSYGIGSSAGLEDEDIQSNHLALGYRYQEDGYSAGVKCIYNESSDFDIHMSNEKWMYGAQGNLPDSDSGPEYSTYTGYTTDKVVAIGVAHFPDKIKEKVPVRRYLSIAAGKSYKFLHGIQCEVDFTPTRFNVTINLPGRNITVLPVNDSNVPDINPSRWLKGVTMRQFELIANDETNLYVSTVGTAFNASITDLRTSVLASSNPDGLTATEIILQGVENSITVMTDDMLGAYAAAQLMIGKFKQTTPATLRLSAIAIGERKYCIAAFALNLAVMLIFALEALRTRWWKGLPDFNMTDFRHVVIAASEGGSQLGSVGFGQDTKIGRIQVKCGDTGVGRFAILLDDERDEKFPIVQSSYESVALAKGWSGDAPPGMI